MKKFIFPLEKVLRFRTSLLEEEKNQLALLRQELHRIEDEIEDNERQLLESDLKMKEIAAKGTSILELNAMHFKIENTRKYIEGLKFSHRAQQKKVDKQLAVVLEATKDVNGLERLKEKQRAEYDEAAAKEENLIISELVSSKYVREQEENQ